MQCIRMSSNLNTPNLVNIVHQVPHFLFNAQNSISAGASPQTPLWSVHSAPPDLLAGFVHKRRERGGERIRGDWGETRERGKGSGQGKSKGRCVVGISAYFRAWTVGWKEGKKSAGRKVGRNGHWPSSQNPLKCALNICELLLLQGGTYQAPKAQVSRGGRCRGG